MLRAELAEMIDLAERLAAADEPAILTTLFSSNGSTYRQLGSMMVSGPPGAIAGGVSGGCLEEYIARHGRSILQRRGAAILSFDADPDAADAGKPVLGCGGSIEVVVERCTASHVAFLRKLHEAYAADHPSTAACVVHASGMSEISVERHWLDDNYRFNAKLERLRHRAIVAKQSRHGTLEPTRRRAMLHYVPPMTRLVIFGAGNDVPPLCDLARSLGWHVTVVDRRARLASRSRFAGADDVLAGDWPIATQQIKFTPQTAVVMMTHSLADDIAIAPLLVDRPAAYLGALGPEHRRRWVLDGAAIEPARKDEFAARLRGPIGLNLGDRSATGIAVSIVAEILAALNDRSAAPLSSSSGPGNLISRHQPAVAHA